jgi:acetyltransferase-like isoleucine patch superfamily enzyme
MIKNNILAILSFLQKNTGFRKFGNNSIIKPPSKIWNKGKIEIGSNVFIAENSFLSVVTEHKGAIFNPTLVIEDNVCIGSGLHISCTDKIVIEKDVLISDRVYIGDGYHGYEDPNLPIIDQQMKSKGPIIIKEGSFIGINAVILPNITIGKHSFIGASAVVTKDIPDYSVVAGNPAKVIKYYNLKLKKWVS